MYQYAFPYYYELVEDWEVEENTNIDVDYKMWQER